MLISRGPLIAALVFLFGSCAPPDQPQPHAPRSLASAARSMRVGDIERLKTDLGKDSGLASRASDLAGKLDPEAWLVVVGASSREHDLSRVALALGAGDDESLVEAIGFGHQQLVADVLSGGGSIYSRRADGRNYFEEGPQPLDLINGFLTPALPAGAQAIEATYLGELQERQFKIIIGLDTGGVVCLSAVLDLASTSVSIPETAARYTDPKLALPATGTLATLDVSGLAERQWLSASFVLVRDDATLERARIARDDRGWVMVEQSSSTLNERLGIQRDERLEFLRLRATDFERVQGRWPRGLHELSFKPWQAVDPAAPSGRLGWADHENKPPVGYELAVAADGDYAVICTHVTQFGRRAMTRDGALIWVR